MKSAKPGVRTALESLDENGRNASRDQRIAVSADYPEVAQSGSTLRRLAISRG